MSAVARTRAKAGKISHSEARAAVNRANRVQTRVGNRAKGIATSQVSKTAAKADRISKIAIAAVDNRNNRIAAKVANRANEVNKASKVSKANRASKTATKAAKATRAIVRSGEYGSLRVNRAGFCPYIGVQLYGQHRRVRRSHAESAAT